MLGKTTEVEKIFYIRRAFLRGVITEENAMRFMYRVTKSYKKVVQYLLRGNINGEPR